MDKDNLGKHPRDGSEDDLPDNTKRRKITAYTISDLQEACLVGDRETIGASLAAGITPDIICINNAITSNDADNFKLLWRHLPPAEQCLAITPTADNPLMLATQQGNLIIVEHIVNSIDSEQVVTALINAQVLPIAIQLGHQPIIEWLQSIIQSKSANFTPVNFKYLFLSSRAYRAPTAGNSSSAASGCKLSLKEYIRLITDNQAQALQIAKTKDNFVSLLLAPLARGKDTNRWQTNPNYLQWQLDYLIATNQKLIALYQEVDWADLNTDAHETIVWFLSYILNSYAISADEAHELVNFASDKLTRDMFKHLASQDIPNKLEKQSNYIFNHALLEYCGEINSTLLCDWLANLHTKEELQIILKTNMRTFLAIIGRSNASDVLQWFFKTLPYTDLMPDTTEASVRVKTQGFYFVGMFTAILNEAPLDILNLYYKTVPHTDLVEILPFLILIYFSVNDLRDDMPELKLRRDDLLQWLQEKFSVDELHEAICSMPDDPNELDKTCWVFDNELFDELEPLYEKIANLTKDMLLDELILPEESDSQEEYARPHP